SPGPMTKAPGAADVQYFPWASISQWLSPDVVPDCGERSGSCGSGRFGAQAPSRQSCFAVSAGNWGICNHVSPLSSKVLSSGRASQLGAGVSPGGSTVVASGNAQGYAGTQGASAPG